MMAELLGFNADIICLQEVDEKAFAVYFRPHLHAAGVHQLRGSYLSAALGLHANGFCTIWVQACLPMLGSCLHVAAVTARL